jgi:hypothetical protein
MFVRMSSRNSHHVCLEFNRDGSSEAFSVTSVIPLQAVFSSKGARRLCFKVPDHAGRVALTQRNPVMRTGLAVNLSLFHAPLIVKDYDGISSFIAGAERGQAQQHRNGGF